jgi:hypothetical protein
MRKVTALSATALALVMALAPVAAAQTAPAAQTPPAATLTVDDIIARNLATKGGADKWKTIQTQKLTGVATAQGFELAMTVYGKRPNVSRQELTLEIPGQDVVTIVTLFDGTTAWTINPMTGSDVPQQAPQAENATAKVQSDFDGALFDYKAKGYTVELLDKMAVAGKQAHHLKVTRADVPTQHYYLDPETFVELKVATEGAVASDTELSDYRAIDGIMVPLDDALFRVK